MKYIKKLANMRNGKVAIVTPTFNARKQVLKFLDSIHEQTYKNLATIIVDDGSSDGTKNAIEKRHPSITVLQGDGNLWWSGATNKGVSYALEIGADYIFTVNNDVKLHKDCIENLVKEAEKLPHSLIGSMICDKDQPSEVWFFGGKFNKNIGDLVHKTGKASDFNNLASAEWLTGMGLLIPAEAFSRIGLFDANKFPQYYGDADFTLRAKKAGYRLEVTPSSRIYVDLSSSWLGHNFYDQPISFVYKSLFSKRSQFNLLFRYRFYRRHWKIHYLFKFYRYFIKTYIIPLGKHRIKMSIRRKL